MNNVVELGALLLPLSTATLLLLSAYAKSLDYESFSGWLRARFGRRAFGGAIVAAEYALGAALLAMLPFHSGRIAALVVGAMLLLVYLVSRKLVGLECKCFGAGSEHHLKIMGVFSIVWVTGVAFYLFEIFARPVAGASPGDEAAALAQASALLLAGAGCLYLSRDRERVVLTSAQVRKFWSSKVGRHVSSFDDEGRMALLVVAQGCEPCVDALSDFEGLATVFADRATFVIASQHATTDSPVRYEHAALIRTRFEDLGVDARVTPLLLLSEKGPASPVTTYVGTSAIRKGLGGLLAG